jgi:hypothetical protein
MAKLGFNCKELLVRRVSNLRLCLINSFKKSLKNFVMVYWCMNPGSSISCKEIVGSWALWVVDLVISNSQNMAILLPKENDMYQIANQIVRVKVHI